jgi:hypothetical protein
MTDKALTQDEFELLASNMLYDASHGPYATDRKVMVFRLKLARKLYQNVPSRLGRSMVRNINARLREMGEMK